MAEREKIVDATNKTLQEFKAKNPDIVGAFIYGSFAKGTLTDESDVDIALLTDGNLITFGTVEQKFSEILRQNKVQRKINIFPLLNVNNKEFIEKIKKELFQNQFIEIT